MKFLLKIFTFLKLKFLGFLTVVALLIGVGLSVVACSPSQSSVAAFCTNIDREIVLNNKKACDDASNSSSCQDFFNGGSTSQQNNRNTYSALWGSDAKIVGTPTSYAKLDYSETEIAVITVGIVQSSTNDFDYVPVTFAYLLDSRNSALKVEQMAIVLQNLAFTVNLKDPTSWLVWKG